MANPTNLTRRAQAWYDAAYRRVDQELAYTTGAPLTAAYEARADIAARYARLASR